MILHRLMLKEQNTFWWMSLWGSMCFGPTTWSSSMSQSSHYPQEDRCASGQRHGLQACPSQAIIPKHGTLVAWYTGSTYLNEILVLHARSGLGSDGGLFRTLGFQRSHLVLSILGSFSTAGMLPKQLCLVLSVFFWWTRESNPQHICKNVFLTFACTCHILSHLVTLFGGLARFQFGRDACQTSEASFFADVLCSLYLRVQIFCCMKSWGFSWIGHNHSAGCTWMGTATANAFPCTALALQHCRHVEYSTSETSSTYQCRQRASEVWNDFSRWKMEGVKSGPVRNAFRILSQFF